MARLLNGIIYMAILPYSMMTLPFALGQTLPPSEPLQCNSLNIDLDKDGLIEICDLEGLNAIRYQLDGSGYRASAAGTRTTAGCAIDGCNGYELTRDLDFNNNASYRNAAVNKIVGLREKAGNL